MKVKLTDKGAKDLRLALLGSYGFKLITQGMDGENTLTLQCLDRNDKVYRNVDIEVEQ